MNLRKFGFLAIALVVACVETVGAQDATTTATTAAVPTSPQNLAGFILPSGSQIKALKAACAACKEKFCKCCIGQMFSSMTMPLTMMSGGCIKPCCPPVSQEALKAPADSAAGACARITKDQLEMEERRKAVRCLARVDCNWYPEAELALINSLRTDKVECVRLEAAKVLSVGCCGTKKIIDALTITVNASSKDGNPPENSPRVREMALVALQHALECYVEREEPQRPELPGGLPAPKSVPEKAPEKAAMREKAANIDDKSGVITAALETLKQGGEGIVQAEAGAQKGMAIKAGDSTENEQKSEVKTSGSQPPKGWGNNSESSEAILSRAMLAIKKNRAPLEAANRPAHQAIGKGERSVVGIFRHAIYGSTSPGSIGGQEGKEMGLKGQNSNFDENQPVGALGSKGAR